MASTESLRKAFGLGAIGFGVFGIAAPSAFVATYGMKSSAATDLFVRLFGTRTIALGVLTLAPVEDLTRRLMLRVAVAMNVADSALVASADGVPVASRVAGTITTGAFAGLGAYLASQS